MIHLHSVNKIYKPDIVALKDINLQIASGEFVSIVGQSGTGKTTLAKLLISQERPTSGSIQIGGWEIAKIKKRQIPSLRRQVSMVFQELNLLSKKTIYENVAFALECCGTPSRKIRKVVPSILELVGIDQIAKRYPAQVSGGEKQRAVIARALVHHPKVLIADEPTGNLDVKNTQDIIKVLENVNQLGTTVVLISHDKSVVDGLQKRVIVMDKGRVVSDVEKGKYKL